MVMLKNLLTWLWGRIADLEFLVCAGSRRSLARHLHLKSLKVSWQEPIRIGHGLYIKSRGNIKLGKRCALGSFTRIWNYNPVEIGDDFIGAGCLVINTATHDPLTLESKGAPVRIGNRVWCGQNVTILSGVTIGDDVVIGAGSVVISDIPPNCIAAGVPARPLKALNRNEQFKHPFFDGGMDTQK